MKKLAIFASGAGSNAQNIINHFRTNNDVVVDLIVCNKPNAGVLSIADNENIDKLIISKATLEDPQELINELNSRNIDLIILAGFLLKIPVALVKAFEDKIVNIHPSLLPKYGGKGMYGHHVHKAVFENKEKESGITIHFVNEKYDDGAFIFQAKCLIEQNDTVEDIEQKVRALEQQHFHIQIDKLLQKE